MHSSRGLGGGDDRWENTLRIEPECPLDEGTEWVVGRSTETVDSSPSTHQWTPGLLFLQLNSKLLSIFSYKECPYIHVLVYVASRMAHGRVNHISIAWHPPSRTVWGGRMPPSAPP